MTVEGDMGRAKSTFLASLALSVAGVLGLALKGEAATVLCPGTPGTYDREFSLTTTPGATCLKFGTGNLNGNGDAVNLLGYVTLDKSDDAGSGDAPGSLIFTPPTSGLYGTFSINAPLGFTNFVVALKSGEGKLDPDWAVFLLPIGVLSGSWAISGKQALSHANLYGQREDSSTPLDPVPLPPALILFGSALVGLTALVRRRRADDAE